MNKYTLLWWFAFGRKTKKIGIACKSHAKSKIADIAFRLGYWAA